IQRLMIAADFGAEGEAGSHACAVQRAEVVSERDPVYDYGVHKLSRDYFEGGAVHASISVLSEGKRCSASRTSAISCDWVYARVPKAATTVRRAKDLRCV